MTALRERQFDQLDQIINEPRLFLFLYGLFSVMTLYVFYKVYLDTLVASPLSDHTILQNEFPRVNALVEFTGKASDRLYSEILSLDRKMCSIYDDTLMTYVYSGHGWEATNRMQECFSEIYSYKRRALQLYVEDMNSAGIEPMQSNIRRMISIFERKLEIARTHWECTNDATSRFKTLFHWYDLEIPDEINILANRCEVEQAHLLENWEFFNFLHTDSFAMRIFLEQALLIFN